MKSYTDLEQSKKLAEILPIESADMEYMFFKKDSSKVINVPFVKDDDEPEWPDDYLYGFIPCWSLAALINLLPSDITIVEEYLTTQYNIDIRKHKLTDDTDVHQIAYGNYGSSGSWRDMINTGEKESLLDAAFEMICWLKNENYI